MEAEAAIHFEYRHQLLFTARTGIVEYLWPMQIEASEKGQTLIHPRGMFQSADCTRHKSCENYDKMLCCVWTLLSVLPCPFVPGICWKGMERVLMGR